jgi:hypothetical protein
MTTTTERPQGRPLIAWKRGCLLAFFICVAISLVEVSPFLWLGNASGHDFQFHAQSWLDAAGQWKEGIVFPRWTEWANHGFGEPRFIFYPPCSWMLGAALSFVVPWNAIAAVFIVLAQTLAGLSAFTLAYRLLPERGALFSAAVYAANPYALLIIYMRSDFAELLAMTFFPLLVLATLQIGGIVDSLGRPPLTSIVAFAFAFAAVWLSNVPAAVLASYSCALLFGWAALTKRSLLPLVRGAAGFALGFGLAGFYLVPAVYEQRWVNIAQALSFGLVPSENFLYSQIDDPEHTLFNWIASTLAVMLVSLTGASAIAASRRATNGERLLGDKPWRSLLLLAALASLLMLRLSAFLWELLPELRFVQFPWRWMSMIALVAACFIAFAMDKRLAWIWFAALFVVGCSFSYFQVTNTWWDGDEVPTMRDALNTGHGFDGTDEYDPLGDDHADLPANVLLATVLPADSSDTAAPQAQVQFLRWSAENKDVLVDTLSPARVALRLLNYPAWRVEVNGKPVTPERLDDFNQMVVPVDAGRSDIRVRFTRTTDRTIGNVISAAAALLAIILFWLTRKRSENNQ